MSDNRSVATDALATLGTIIDDKQKRDAIHLAVEPIVAGEVLRPGNHIKIDKGVAYRIATGEGLSIVDPFLGGTVKKGERFWLILYPRTINSLRHVWSHPSFPDEVGTEAPDKSASEAWLRKFCHDSDSPDYDTVMELIDKGSLPSTDTRYYTSGGDYGEASLHFRGEDASGAIPSEFWIHAEIVLGRKLLYHPEYFSCSC